MRKVTLTLAIALLFAGSAVSTADAQTSRGANNIAGAAQNFTPIEPAACRGWGPFVGLDLSARAVGIDAGVVPAGNGHAKAGPPNLAASSLRDWVRV
jgi:hypothetical protein